MFGGMEGFQLLMIETFPSPSITVEMLIRSSRLCTVWDGIEDDIAR